MCLGQTPRGGSGSILTLLDPEGPTTDTGRVVDGGGTLMKSQQCRCFPTGLIGGGRGRSEGLTASNRGYIILTCRNGAAECVVSVTYFRTLEITIMFRLPFGPSLRYLRHLLVFIYAIEEINNSTELLPNTTLGYHIYDSCTSEVIGLKSLLSILSEDEKPTPNYICTNRQKLVAVIGHLLTSTTKMISDIVQVIGYPQISYGSLNPYLTNCGNFASIFRTVPSEYSQISAVIQLLIHFGWTWVGVITAEDRNYKSNEYLQHEFNKNGICIAFNILTTQSLRNNYLSVFQISQAIQNPSVTVIVLYCSIVPFITLMRHSSSFLSSKVWVSAVSKNIIGNYEFNHFLHPFNGSLFVSIHSGNIPGFIDFFSHSLLVNNTNNHFINTFKDQVKQLCNLDNEEMCYETVFDKLLSKDEITTFRLTYTTYMAVYAIANVLNKIELSRNALHLNDWPQSTRYKLKYFLRKSFLQLKSGENLSFDDKGDVPGKFDIVNAVIYANDTVRERLVGTYLATSKPPFCINENLISWSPLFNQIPTSVCSKPCPVGYRKALKSGRKPCCFDCILCSDGHISNKSDSDTCIQCHPDHYSNPTRDKCIKRQLDFLSYEDYLGATMASLSVTLMVTTIAVFYVFLNYRDTPIVKANNCNLSYILLVSLKLSFLCSLLFIGRPTDITCHLRQMVFLVIFSVAISSILGKTLIVIAAFNSTKPHDNWRFFMNSTFSFGLIIVCTLGEFLICLAWIIWAPPFVDYDTSSVKKKLILKCNEGSTLAFYIAISYIGLLAICCYTVAFSARKLPDSFNEARNITFSMLIFCSVWITFIPSYMSTKGKDVVAVEIFAILSSAGGLLCSIFFPKCYILLINPSFNVKKQFASKNHKI
ncbi:vomeronasal type-2 receptor 26-like [Dendropsophus ebraccatus]|uniref:vomeronasal type-2 receptor 26-like n=1 Tax=Dendropsophus ebraccatus TaxID=150705 RepID=UPI0038313CD9